MRRLDDQLVEFLVHFALQITMCSVIFAGLNCLRSAKRISSLANTGPYRISLSFYSESKQSSNQDKIASDGHDATSGLNETSESGDPLVQQLREENSSLLERVKEIDDKFKRALADGENTRVRMRKQIEEARVFGIQSFCKDLLEVADVLDKAITSVSPDEVKANATLSDLFTGVKMTSDQLQTIFRRHGLVQINPLGEKFNPNDHHAMFEAVVPGKEPGTVSVVTQIGYKLKERTIRPAMVGVVKAS